MKMVSHNFILVVSVACFALVAKGFPSETAEETRMDGRHLQAETDPADSCPKQARCLDASTRPAGFAPNGRPLYEVCIWWKRGNPCEKTSSSMEQMCVTGTDGVSDTIFMPWCESNNLQERYCATVGCSQSATFGIGDGQGCDATADGFLRLDLGLSDVLFCTSGLRCRDDDEPVCKWAVPAPRCSSSSRKLDVSKPDSMTMPNERKLQVPVVNEVCEAPPDCKEFGMCGGDPHFQTWSGTFFDYHGECDLVFLKATKFDKGLGLNIHIRTTGRYGYSFIQSAALQIGDDVLEVSSFGEYRMNGVLSAQMPYVMADKYPVNYQQTNKKVHSFNIHLGGTESIVISTNKDLVTVKMGNATEASFGESVGLMGDFLDGKMLARDGTTVLNDDPEQFGQEWQVLDTEPKLFEILRAPQYPQKCNRPGSKQESQSRRLGEAISKEVAAKACAEWGEHKDLCVYDVIVMGDLEIAQAGGY